MTIDQTAYEVWSKQLQKTRELYDNGSRERKRQMAILLAKGIGKHEHRPNTNKVD